MPKVVNTPEVLRPYTFHGLSLSWKEGDTEAMADCPFCGKEGKLSINIDTGKWRCFTCNRGAENGKAIQGGNVYTFLRLLWEESSSGTDDHDLRVLANEKHLLKIETLKAWGVCRSTMTGEWLLPAYNLDGNLNQLYRFLRYDGKYRWVLTPTLGHGLFGVQMYQKQKPNVDLLEGPWDAMAWWEMLSSLKNDDSAGFVQTGNQERSVLTNTNVLAVPGCTTFKEGWLPLFSEKYVHLFYDNDHPRVNEQTRQVIPAAGLAGMERHCSIMTGYPRPPLSVKYLAWSDKGYDRTMPNGTDVRDVLTYGRKPLSVGDRTNPTDNIRARTSYFIDLMEMLKPVPPTWVREAATASPNGAGGPQGGNGRTGGHNQRRQAMQLSQCTDYATVVKAWRKAMRWTEGLDGGLSVMLASVVSTPIIGDQLWVKVIGPPSCGKSTLCEAISTNAEYIEAKSTIRGFHSGFSASFGGRNMDPTGNEEEMDHSLISRVKGKTLIIKDADTLVTSPNLDQILAEGRDLYDGTSRSHYRNSKGKEYDGIRMTWILCGTASLRQLDTSELGARFLDYVIMEEVDEDMEEEIATRVAYRTLRGMAIVSNGKAETQYDPEMAVVMKLTGGYVSYLRENAADLFAEVEMEDAALLECRRLAKFVAFMRARPSKKQLEQVEREFSARLVSQLVRLAMSLAVVMNRKTVDDVVMARVRKVALDTARGQTLEMAKMMYASGQAGVEELGLAMRVNLTELKVRDLLRFLRHIKVVEVHQPTTHGVKMRKKFRLTESVTKLYRHVMEGKD